MGYYFLSPEVLALAIAGFCLALALLFCAPQAWRGPRVLVGLAAFAAIVVYPADYTLRIRPFFHQWEQYHLLMSAKYFRELGYHDFYRCAQAADQQDAPQRWTHPQVVRDLERNELRLHPQIQGPDCAAVFGPARWSEYRHDIAYFAAQNEDLKEGRWLGTFRDFGVNVTPFWAGFYRLIAGSLEVSAFSTTLLSLADLALLLSALALIFHGWGATRGALAVLFLSLNEGTRPGWIVGSMFRGEWFLLLILGAYLLKRQRVRSALFAVGLSCLFRPIAWLTPLTLIARAIWRRQSREWLWPGGALILVAVPLLLSAGDWQTVTPAFVRNVGKYENSFLTNRLGLVPLVSTPSLDQMQAGAREIIEAEPGLRDLPGPIASESLYRRLMARRLKAVSPYLILALALALFIWGRLQSRLKDLDAYLFGSALALLILSPPVYYGMALVVLLLVERLSERWLAALFACLCLFKLLALVYGQQAQGFAWASALFVSLFVAQLVVSLRAHTKIVDH